MCSFNIIAGAMAIPADLKEAAAVFRFGRRERWQLLILPGIFPYLITGPGHGRWGRVEREHRGGVFSFRMPDNFDHRLRGGHQPSYRFRQLSLAACSHDPYGRVRGHGEPHDLASDVWAGRDAIQTRIVREGEND
jgi:hypothetical protein